MDFRRNFQGVNGQKLGQRPFLQYSQKELSNSQRFNKIVVECTKNEQKWRKNQCCELNYACDTLTNDVLCEICQLYQN